jgi:hypothetical protein
MTMLRNLYVSVLYQLDRVVPSELRYGYFCGNIVSEDDAWVSSY